MAKGRFSVPLVTQSGGSYVAHRYVLIASLLLCAVAVSGGARSPSASREEQSKNPQTEAREAAPAIVAQGAGNADKSDPLNHFIGEYCSRCHSARVKRGGLVLQGVSAANPATDPALWENVLRRVSGSEMPPLDASKRPEPAEVRAFSALLMNRLDRSALTSPFVGSAPVRRLSRTEYGNALRDLFGIDLPFADDMPGDGLVACFDNVGDALAFSPALLDSYLRLSRRAVFDVFGRGKGAVTSEFLPKVGQAGWIGPGAPFGTRGGIFAKKQIIQSGTYEIRAIIDTNGLTPLDGVSLFRHRLKLGAGSHGVVAAFSRDAAQREGPLPDIGGPGGAPGGGPLDPLGSAVRPTLQFFVDGKRIGSFAVPGATPSAAAFGLKSGPPTLARMEVEGPIGAVETPVWQNGIVFICRPKGANDEEACATRILTKFARRAFRRDLSTAEATSLVAGYRKSRSDASFEWAVTESLRQILTAPQFLLRLEDDRGRYAGKTRNLSEYETASRLSFFLWSSIPDDGLLDDARAGRLRSKTALRETVKRMLQDRRADALVDNFAMQWLGLRGVRKIMPDRAAYPLFDESMREDLSEESRLFLSFIFRNNRPITEILNANYSYLNNRLATLYGAQGVRGAAFRRVTFAPGSPRGGILGQGSMLMLTSHTDKTAPVLRGKWVLDNLLNSAPPPPPANVPTLNAAPGMNGKKLSSRQQVERHREDPQCSSCHVRMDPIGFSLENFDVLGRWRNLDDGLAIDATAQMPDGRKFSGPQGLKAVLAGSEEQFVGASVARMMTYALGRQLEARDQPTVRRIVREAKAGGYRVHDLVSAIIASDQFLKKLGNDA